MSKEKDNEHLSRSVIMKGLDFAYDKAILGVANFESAEALAKAYQKENEDLLKSSITNTHRISGGDVSSAYLISLKNSKQYFVKYNSKSTAYEMFQKEQRLNNCILLYHTEMHQFLCKE